MTPSKILFLLCISFILGISVQSLVQIPQPLAWGILVFGFFAFIVVIILHDALKRYSVSKRRVWHDSIIVIFCFFLFVVGVARLQMSQFAMASDALYKLNDTQEKITLTGRVAAEPDIRSASQKLRIKIDNTNSVLLVTLQRYPEYHYLDEITVTGTLKKPVELENFSYKNYLAKDGIYSVMDFPKTTLISNEHQYNIFSFAYEKILWFKGKLKESIATHFAPPGSFILEGVILGNDKNIDQQTRAKLNATGLSHLTAISGSNIIILSTIMMACLLMLGFWRGQAFYISLVFIWLYVLIAGFPASGVRAGIMGTVLLSAEKFGRQNTSQRTIVLAGAVMLLQNPMLLAYDIGFQLSFMSSMGIIYVKPLIDVPLSGVRHWVSYIFRYLKKETLQMMEEKTKKFTDIISIALAAQLATAPLIAYYFKGASLIAPLPNLFIIPIIDVLMVLGFVAAFLGIFSNTLGFLFSLPCTLILVYFLKVMDVFYQPWAVVLFENVLLIWLAVYYVTLVALIAYLQRIQKPKFLGY